MEQLIEKKENRILAFINTPGFDKLYRVITMFICLIVLCIVLNYTIKHGIKLDGATLVLSAIIWLLQTLANFDWGSSAGSKEKDKVIASSNPPTNPIL
jgi:hypothetical protein